MMIAITGIHGNFYSNPFYYNIGDTLNAGGIDFFYAQTNDAFGQIETINVNTGKEETIGSWNERFAYTDEDIDAYLTFAVKEGYEHISSSACRNRSVLINAIFVQPPIGDGQSKSKSTAASHRAISSSSKESGVSVRRRSVKA